MFEFNRPTTPKDFAVIAGLGLICLPLLLSLLPNLEPGTEEVRITQSFIEAKRFHGELAGAVRSEDGFVAPTYAGAIKVTKISFLDPWGQPYQIVTRRGKDAHLIRVFSYGPDASSASYGLDQDDIASDMKANPTHRFEVRRRRQWQLAYGISGTAWIGAIWFYLVTTRRKSQIEDRLYETVHRS